MIWTDVEEFLALNRVPVHTSRSGVSYPGIPDPDRPRTKVIRPLTTHCRNGHEYTPENTQTYYGTRRCIICRRAQGKAHRLAKKRKAAILE